MYLQNWLFKQCAGFAVRSGADSKTAVPSFVSSVKLSAGIKVAMTRLHVGIELEGGVEYLVPSPRRTCFCHGDADAVICA